MPKQLKKMLTMYVAFAIVLAHAVIPHHHAESEAVHLDIFETHHHHHGEHHHHHDHADFPTEHSHPPMLDVTHGFEFFKASNALTLQDNMPLTISELSLSFERLVFSVLGFKRSPEAPPNDWLIARTTYLPSEFYPNLSLLAPPVA